MSCWIKLHHSRVAVSVSLHATSVFLGLMWPQAFSPTWGPSLSLFLVKESHLQQWTVILLKRNSFDASLKPPLRPRWSKMKCLQPAGSGHGVDAQRFYLYLIPRTAFTSQPPSPPTDIQWFQTCWPLSEAASLVHQRLTRTLDTTGEPSAAAVKWAHGEQMGFAK